MTVAPEQVRAIAARLCDIATHVAEEAASLTIALRAAGEHAQDVAVLASDMDVTAEQIESNMTAQLALLARAQELVADNEPVMAALTASAAMITEMSAKIRELADHSRLLTLNARIEASRSDDALGFAAVADAMTGLTEQTRAVTRDIAVGASTISDHAEAARLVIVSGNRMVHHEQALLSTIADTTSRQRSTAARVKRLTVGTVERIDDAANGIGRVASAASIVGMLAREMQKL